MKQSRIALFSSSARFPSASTVEQPLIRPAARLRAALVGAMTFALLLPAATYTAMPAAAAAEPIQYGAPDSIAADYYGALLRHTRWSESMWDPSINAYKFVDFNFAVVLGNAVLLTHGEYDAEIAGVSKDVLRTRTLASIKYYAALNRFVNPNGTWGKKLFWDSTFQSYFLDAAKLLWDELDETTRTNLTSIAVGQSRYTADLDYGNDPLSGSWTADWPTGKHVDDTAQEESGVYTQALAPGLAWAPDDADAARWSGQFSDWARNAAGQPTADANNPAIVAGKPISSNTMQTIYDTYLVENHGSFGPHYQSDIWRSGGRNAIQFILNDRPVPDILTEQPNSAELWESIKLMMSDQGEPFMPMVNDREFLYGRDVLPIAFVGQVLRDPDAVRAEANLAAALEDYQAYAPTNRLTKFSGEPKYEPEARAEIAISYLLHVEAANSAEGAVQPTPQNEFFEKLTGVRDFGAGPGFTVQQSEKAWAAASSHPGYVKFPWVPDHNSWLFYVSGAESYLYPDTSATVDSRNTAVYTEPRDGFEGTASLFTIGDDHSGQVTLPTGSSIYASSGAGRDDGSLSVRNLDMDGYAGLDGSRTYSTSEGDVTESLPPAPVVDPLDVNAARVDTFDFAPTAARYVRMQGIQGNPTYGYSLYSFHVSGGDSASASDLAAGKVATASSQDSAGGRQAAKVTDASASTRWSVSTADRARGDSWIQVDLGTTQAVDGVRLAWEASAGVRYLVQTSTDGVVWDTQSTYGAANPADANVNRLDTIELTPAGSTTPAPVDARFVRMQGVQGSPAYGYSLYHLRALTSSGTDAAAGKPATASSAVTGRPASAVTDGSATSRWAVAVEERSRDDSWVQVDLGAPTAIAKVQLGWESAAGREYRIQTSIDGETWTDAASYRYTGDQITSTTDNWVNVEGSAGFVVRGSDAPITVSREDNAHHVVRLVDSSEARETPFLVEMLPATASETAAEEAVEQPTVEAGNILASTLDGYLSLFNLSDEEATTEVTVPYSGNTVSLFSGDQRLGETSSTISVTVPAASAVVLSPRFEIPRAQARERVAASVDDGRSLSLVSRDDARIDVRNVETGKQQTAELVGDAESVLRFSQATPFPVRDLALSTITFPGSVLPKGMTSPALAVDGDLGTTWTPGPDGRMVVDLGARSQVGSVALAWDGVSVPDAVVSVSDDGLAFRDVGKATLTGKTSVIAIDEPARYVAVKTDWAEGDSSLAAFKVLPVGVTEPIAPVAVDGDLPVWTVGEAATGSLSATGTPEPELTVTSGALPLGVTFESGSFAGIPTAGGAFEFTITASNGEGEPVSRTFSGVVNKLTTTLGLTATARTRTTGTLEATIQNGAGDKVDAATGTVRFYASSTPGSASIGTKQVVNGTATLSMSRLQPGSTTTYSAEFTPSESGAASYTAATSGSVDLTTPDRAESSVAITTKPTTYGKSGTVSVRVSSEIPVTGSVHLYVDGRSIGVQTLSKGTASIALPKSLSAGKHTVRVTYSGNENIQVSERSTTITVRQATAKVTLKLSSHKAFVKKTKIKATIAVTVPGTSVHATGKVAIKVSGKTVKTVSVSSAKNGRIVVTLPKFTKTGSKVTVTAEYLGSANLTSASARTTVRVER